ncbi:MAG: DUF3489 domain-containing protein [Thermomicrobiales bacterium]
MNTTNVKTVATRGGTPEPSKAAEGAGGKPKRSANKAKTSEAKAKEPVAPTSKAETILALLRRKKGASIDEMQQATGWQAHSVRGFLSGHMKKKLGLTVTSEIGKDGVRRYRTETTGQAG